jgi:hypothetical protein
MQITLDITFDKEVKDDTAVVGNVSDAIRRAIQNGVFTPDDSSAVVEQVMIWSDRGYAQVYKIKEDIVESV